MTDPSVPNWETFMVPVLEVLSDGQQRTRREMFAAVGDSMGLSDQQRAELLNSGQSRADNRMGWAISALARAEAITRPRRGQYLMTEAGHALLSQHRLNGLTEKKLMEVPVYREYVPIERSSASLSRVAVLGVEADTALDPIEQIEQGFTRLKADVTTQLLKRLRDQDPAFLEQSVLDVLVAMGYGGTDKQARRIGGTGDGGVDGVIDQDKLGLQRIYVQAKRYAPDNIVGREAIQAFVGALHGRNVTQGIFITTSRFTPNAVAYAESIGSRIILIDGARFADLMITYGVGVQLRNTYAVVELDEDYFE